METVAKKRNPAFEGLRILSMIMVIVLHGLGKGGLLKSMSDGGVNGYICWLLEALCISAVNVYVLISGYFLVKSKFHTGRLIELFLQTLFYSIIGLFVGILINTIDKSSINAYEAVRYVFPLHNNTYWFVSKYIVMYMFMPLLSRATIRMNEKQLRLVIAILLIYECVIKSICPQLLINETRGYDIVWFLVLFTVAAYIRLYGIKWFDRTCKGVIVYFAGVIMIFVEELALQTVSAKTGHFVDILKISYDYNHIFVLISAIGIFMAFKCLSEKVNTESRASKVICALSPMTLGVYLVHENPAIKFEWPKWFKIPENAGKNPFVFVVTFILSVLAVYVIATAIDFIRKLIFDFVKKYLKKTGLHKKLEDLDGVINAEPEN